jgi:hypothetical protein
MLGTMTILADAGIGTGVISQGGKVWQDPAQLGSVMVTGLNLRKKFAIGSMLVAAPILIYLLRYHGASWILSFLLLASLIPAFLSALSDTLLEIAPKLRQDIMPLQRNQMAAAVARLLLTSVGLFAFPWAAAAILASGVSRGWANIRLRKISGNYADREQPPDPAVQKSILTIVKKTLPTSIYYCLSGQITIWLISIFGSTKAVGQIGALNGFSTCMNLFTVIFGTLIVPRYARLPNRKKLLVETFLLVQVGLILMSVAIVVMTGFFSKELLWILGKRFSGLRTELILVAAETCVTFISTSTNQMLSARGIVVPPVAMVFFALAAQFGFAFVLPVSQVVGVLWYAFFTALTIYTVRLIYLAITFARFETTLAKT